MLLSPLFFFLSLISRVFSQQTTRIVSSFPRHRRPSDQVATLRSVASFVKFVERATERGSRRRGFTSTRHGHVVLSVPGMTRAISHGYEHSASTFIVARIAKQPSVVGARVSLSLSRGPTHSAFSVVSSNYLVTRENGRTKGTKETEARDGE